MDVGRGAREGASGYFKGLFLRLFLTQIQSRPDQIAIRLFATYPSSTLSRTDSLK